MTSRQRPSWPGALFLCGLVLAAAHATGSAGTLPSASTLVDQNQAPGARISKTFGKIPLYFIENRGQVDAQVTYYVQGLDTSIFFTSQGVTFTLSGLPERKKQKEKGKREQPPHLASLMPGAFGRAMERPGDRRRHVLTLDFVGANPAVKPIGKAPTPAVVSYFSGPREQWKTGLKTYSELVYPDLWPGIDLIFSGTTNRLKYTFLVKSGAAPEQIRLAYRGATTVGVNEAGELDVSTPVGGFRDEKPYAYQEIDGNRVEVVTSYTLRGAGPSTTHRSPRTTYEYGFRVGKYDRSRPLVLDPAFLVYAGYIGGGGDDRGLGIAVDSFGNAYVTGSIFSIVTNSDDAFVAKVNAGGTGLDYFVLIGGAAFDAGFDIAVDGDGNAYVVGAAVSTQATFPVTVGPDLTHSGSGDAFVAKVNADGRGLVYAGYIGGSGLDFAEGIALDSLGNAYVTGGTKSTQATFPVTVGPDLTHNGGFDVFMCKVKAVPNDPVVTNNFHYCGYIGGSGDDVGIFGNFVTSGHIAIDAFGNAYVSGMTTSTQATFPVTVGPDLTHNGKYDAFVCKVKADPSDPVVTNNFHYCGYIGGSGNDFGFGMAVDASGNAYITGRTTSTQATFPVTVGPDLTHNGGTDAFVAKVKADGTGLVYAGYIGGKGLDQGLGLALDSFDNVYVVGHTHSSEATFPVTVGPDLTFNGAHGNGDAFVCKVKANPSDPVVTNNFHYCGYIGGSGEDAAFWIALDSSGNAYVVGDTTSTEATFPDGDGFGSLPGPDQTHNGGSDAFVVKIAN